MAIQQNTKHLVQFIASKQDISIELAYDVELNEVRVFVGLDAIGGSMPIDIEELEKWMAIVQDMRA